MKVGRTHFGDKPETAGDLEREVFPAAPVQHGTVSDGRRLLSGVVDAQ
jgi:hypothetical protein